jgi:low temperature requirement protein LtrA
MSQPLPERHLVHAPGRRATWFELFFDLVFVAAVAQLSGHFAEHYDAGGALRFALLFFVLWWAWLGHTFHASRFDEDRVDQRAVGMAQMLAVVLIGYGAGNALGERAWSFASGMAAFKGLLALSYLRERHRPYARGLVRAYVGVYLAQAAIWSVSLATSGDARVALWASAFAIDLVTPFVVARHTHAVPPHPEHLPERFGLFTLILLGESMAAAIHGLDHAGTLPPGALAIAGAAALIAFLFWVGYFVRVRGAAERHVAHEEAGRRLRVWAYAHVPLYLGVAGIAGGTVVLIGHPQARGAEPLLFAGAAGLAMLGLSTIGASHAAALPQALRRVWPHALIAVATAGLPFAHEAFRGGGIVPACALAAAGQLSLAARRRLDD